jgi:predicted anti-sigma-YlaC factor YlaD
METQIYSALLSPGGCITAVTLRRYLDSSLRPAEKVRVDEHLRQCIICSEALEGFKRHRSDDFLQSDLEFLSHKIRRRYSSKRTNKQGLPVTIVYSLVVFFIILIIIYYIIRFLISNP